MGKFAQYTIPQCETITLSNLARHWKMSRKLLFQIMEEQGILIVSSKAKRLSSAEFGFATYHVTRTSIYIYTNKINSLFLTLNLIKLDANKRMCFKCRAVKSVGEFKERMAVCMHCKEKKFKKDEKNIKKSKMGINPYFLRRK